MWSTETIWFDVAIVMSIFAVGNVCLGHFEEHKPKSRRVLKIAVVTGLVALLSYAGFRWVAYSLIGIMGLAAAYVHFVWLPRHGVNGWTGEPRDKYYELLGVRGRGK
jgi:hypothetical protein